MNPTDHIPALVARLYAIVAELEAHFPGRRFTPDGHLVGSLGEVLAAERYGLRLHRSSTQGHDAVAKDGRQVQIKATQGDTVGIRSECEHLIVLQLLRDGSVREVFNGPGELAWNSAGKMQKNGQRPISVSRLQQLMASVPVAARIPLR